MNKRIFDSCCCGAFALPMRRMAVVTVLLVSVPGAQVYAQSERDLVVDRAAVRADSQARATDLFAEGRDEEARALIASTNIRSEGGTARWHCETAGRMLHIAWAFSAEGRTDLADKVASLALDQTVLAIEAAGESEGPITAAALTTAALIQERFLGDIEAAKASLHRALEFDPESESVRESLDRFARVERQAESRNARN